MKKYLPVGVLAVAIALGAVWYLTRVEIIPFEGAVTKQGDFVIAKDQKALLKSGASLSVIGHLAIDGQVVCDKGGVTLGATEGITINGSIACTGEGGGLVLISSHEIQFGSGATVDVSGGVQIVSDGEKIKKTQGEIDALYEDIGKDQGTGTRVGPFVEENATQRVSVSSAAPVPTEDMSVGEDSLWLKASAHGPTDSDGKEIENVIISGTWHIGDGGALPRGVEVPTPSKAVKKIVLNFDLGKNQNATLKDFYLVGPNGRDGESDLGSKCVARGTKGEDAFRMRLVANNIDINNVTFALGNGGKGGDAETGKDCDPGIATGGDGGEAGNFKLTALGKISINSLRITPGVGGIGGNAIANGKDGVDGCPGTKGGDARATGGKGGNNKKELAATGAVDGIKNITIDRIDGGWGGEATARPGNGGNGSSCKCRGGAGGSGSAIGGAGGIAMAKIIGGSAETHGGTGGDVSATGGTGGAGGSCPLKPSGGAGGKGGDATARPGKGGSGDSSTGTDGRILDEKGGDGGMGGSGCGPGNGGAGGSPNGQNGLQGERQCPEEQRSGATIVPGTANQVKPTTVSDKKKITVIQYNGKFLPVDQLIIENEVGCGADHWHASRGVVQATDGSYVPDPGPQCGYGKVSEKPKMEIAK